MTAYDDIAQLKAIIKKQVGYKRIECHALSDLHAALEPLAPTRTIPSVAWPPPPLFGIPVVVNEAIDPEFVNVVHEDGYEFLLRIIPAGSSGGDPQ